MASPQWQPCCTEPAHHRRIEHIFDHYRGLLSWYQQTHPDAFALPHRSKSTETDALVLDVFRSSAPNNTDEVLDRFEADVMFALQYVWNTAMATLPVDQVGGLRLAADVMQRLNECPGVRARQALIRQLYDLKDAVGARPLWWQSDAEPCAVLGCPTPVEPNGYRFNGFQYCAKHVGTALFHGFRHAAADLNIQRCSACAIWYILGMRTSHDPGHAHMTARKLQPLTPVNPHSDMVVFNGGAACVTVSVPGSVVSDPADVAAWLERTGPAGRVRVNLHVTGQPSLQNVDGAVEFVTQLSDALPRERPVDVVVIDEVITDAAQDRWIGPHMARYAALVWTVLAASPDTRRVWICLPRGPTPELTTTKHWMLAAALHACAASAPPPPDDAWFATDGAAAYRGFLSQTVFNSRSSRFALLTPTHFVYIHTWMGQYLNDPQSVPRIFPPDGPQPPNEPFALLAPSPWCFVDPDVLRLAFTTRPPDVKAKKKK